MWMRGKISSFDAVGYVVAQCMGAVIASLLLLQLAADPANLAANVIGEGYTISAVLL